MSDVVTLEITGLAGVEEGMRTLGAKLAKKAMRRALQAAINVIDEEITNRTPIDTGATIGKAQTTVSINAKDGSGVAKFGYGNRGFQARMVEYGHEIVGPKKTGSKHSGHVPAKPFMRPGFDVAAPKAIEAFTQVINEEISNL